MTIAQALKWARAQLADFASSRSDCDLLICHVLRCQPAYLISDNNQQLTSEQQQQLEQIIDARRNGLPVAHLIGYRGFWSLDIEVNSHTLIPRPDTELLVSMSLSKIQPGMRIVDLGTGSGAIALAIRSERKDIWIVATDYSAPALCMAQRNSQKLHLPLPFIRAAWLEPFQAESLDMILSNPPYIPEADPHLETGDLRYEPLSALASGKDGLKDICQIVRQSVTVLKPGGWLMVEHGYDQSVAVQTIFEQCGFNDIETYQDFGHQDRVVIGRKSKGL